MAMGLSIYKFLDKIQETGTIHKNLFLSILSHFKHVFENYFLSIFQKLRISV